MAVQLREFSTGAEMLAHYASIRARREALRPPSPKPAPQPTTLPANELTIAAALSVPTSIKCHPGTHEPKAGAGSPPPPTIAEIVDAVCGYYKIKRVHLRSSRRSWDIVRPRQRAMWLAYRLTGHTMTTIGRQFGGFDHTTVLHAIRKTEELLALNPALRAELLAIEFQLQPPIPIAPDTLDPNQLALPLAGEAGG